MDDMTPASRKKLLAAVHTFLKDTPKSSPACALMPTVRRSAQLQQPVAATATAASEARQAHDA